MAYTATCPDGEQGDPAGGWGPSGLGMYLHYCPSLWETGEGTGWVVHCPGDTNEPLPPGEGEPGQWTIGCAEQFTYDGEEEPGVPDGFGPDVAMQLFVGGFAIAAAFWAMGKGLALVVRMLGGR